MMIDFNQFNEAESAALMEHQRRIADRDKDKRRRAMREYRKFLDYLERIGRITPAQKTKLEYWRMEERHVKDRAVE